MTIDFAGKVVLVVGAGTGIGAAIARGFNTAGADLALSYHGSKGGAEEVAEEVRASGHRCLVRAVDARSVAAIEELVDDTVRTLGGIDVLVYNAGLTDPHPFFELTEAEWDRTLDINLKSMFCARRAALHMREQDRKGSMVLLSSIHSIVTNRNNAHYASSKGGINMLTRSLALELAPLGIRVNAIAPGYIYVERHRDQGIDPEEPGRHVPLGRLGTPAEIADVAVFLSSDHASYVTGSVLFVDGGLSIRMSLPPR